MRRTLGALWRLLKGLPLALIAPVLFILAALALFLTDLIATLRPRKSLAPSTRPASTAASIVIPNWNGRDLLEKYLPTVLARCAAVPGKRSDRRGQRVHRR